MPLQIGTQNHLQLCSHLQETSSTLQHEGWSQVAPWLSLAVPFVPWRVALVEQSSSQPEQQEQQEQQGSHRPVPEHFVLGCCSRCGCEDKDRRANINHRLKSAMTTWRNINGLV